MFYEFYHLKLLAKPTLLSILRYIPLTYNYTPNLVHRVHQVPETLKFRTIVSAL
ncbi:hypothetical protein BVRB_011990 [Beta vulgaris subsp. vulgaris]|uniref:Uncharacterized protein n=1 Tax=Beta vulgaris subsp. vulgaris TaxID=3555 RepID=A0A0J8B2C6_BETVV|nr:hypothetical protein BVRB_011990 [Beta vulgaris subsp. vulgaris]